jgi:hypothetical protein
MHQEIDDINRQNQARMKKIPITLAEIKKQKIENQKELSEVISNFY